MKKILFILAFIFTTNVVFGQSTFDKLEDLDEVSSFVMTKDAFELISKFPDAKSESLEFFNVLKGLNELKVFSSENSDVVSKMESMVSKAVKKSKLIELMRAKDKGFRMKIYIKSTGNKELASEVLMFKKDKTQSGKVETSIISLTGEIDVNKLAKIANKFSDENKK